MIELELNFRTLKKDWIERAGYDLSIPNSVISSWLRTHLSLGGELDCNKNINCQWKSAALMKKVSYTLLKIWETPGFNDTDSIW